MALRVSIPASKAVLVAVHLLLCSPAWADSTIESTAGLSSPAGSCVRAIPGGAAAAYFNPALLIYAPDSFEMGFGISVEQLEITPLARPAGVDIPDSIYTARLRDANGLLVPLANQPLPSSKLISGRQADNPDGVHEMVAFGSVKKFWNHRFAFGFYSILPLTYFQVQNPFFADEREQYFSNSLGFERYGDSLLQNAFVFAIAVRPLDWLSVGAGVTFSNLTEVANSIYMPDAGKQELSLVNADVTVHTRLVPHFGIVVEPIERLLLSSTLHLPLESRVVGQSRLQFWNFNYPGDEPYLVQEFKGSYGVDPLRTSVNVSWDTELGSSGPGLTLAGSATWTRWSQYLDRHQGRPAGFSDTFAGGLSGTLNFDSHSVSIDAGIEPSPVPEQTGRTNYVDNTRLMFGSSYGYVFDVGGKKLEVRAGIRASLLLERSHSKDLSAADPVIDEFPDGAVDALTGETIHSSQGLQTNNPGYPGFSSSGFVLLFSSVVRLHF